MNWKQVATRTLLAAALAVGGGAAHSEEPASVWVEKQVIVKDPGNMPAEDLGPGPGTMVFLSSEFGSDRLVKGAPYSAEAVTERTQALADGNRIVQTNTAMVYRDGEGRTRREQHFGMIGGMNAEDKPRTSVMIHDPVRKEHYVMEPEDRTARKMPLGPHPIWRHAPSPHDGKEPFDIPLPPRLGNGPHDVFVFSAQPSELKTEPLGRQFIEGVEAEGTRSVSVIPAGQIGNERAIEIITEKWYSPELQVNVMTRHADPRFGETVYRLRNVQRSEPDPSLFQVPADYKIEEGPAGDRIVIRKKEVD